MIKEMRKTPELEKSPPKKDNISMIEMKEDELTNNNISRQDSFTRELESGLHNRVLSPADERKQVINDYKSDSDEIQP